jgi:lipoprotein-anchoring transpeptidase ErfK/SrfK
MTMKSCSELSLPQPAKPGTTRIGVFETSAKQKDNTWTKPDGSTVDYFFFTQFDGGIGFHSVLFGKHKFVDEGNRLFAERKPSSMGCVRLMKEDAEWIYKLPLGLKIEVVEF